MASRNQVFADADSGQLLIAALSRFALELYKEQLKENHIGNAFMSPLSISAVLNMTLLGSRGKTLAEMKSTLFLDDLGLEDDSKLHQSFGDLISHFNRCNTEIQFSRKVPFFQLHMANRMYAEKSYKILDEFQVSCKKYYDTELVPVSFWDEPKIAAHQINSWIQEQTNEKIKDVISPNCIDDKTTLILVNAIYFKSAWRKPFPKDNTKDDGFYFSPKETLRVKMMHQTFICNSYYRSSDLLCQVLEFPYLGSALSMFILLPDEAWTLEAMEERLTADHLQGIDSGFVNNKPVLMNFWLPKFKMEETLDLSEVLRKMGMESLFEEGSADLSGIDGTDLLFASKVMHKTFVDVNEEGTEAAAATSGSLLGGSKEKPEVVDFRVDRPFLFFIREERTKAILFLGRVVKPSYD